MEKILVLGNTDSTISTIDQLKKRDDITVIWAGENIDPKKADELGVTPVEVNHSSSPDTFGKLVDEYQPDMVFAGPGSDRELVNLIEGDTLDNLLLESSAKKAKIPVVIVSSQYHG